MKKLRLLYLAALVAISSNAFALTETKTVDAGYDWDTTTPTTVIAATGTVFDAETDVYTFNSGATSEVNFIIGGGATVGAAAKNSVYTATSSQVPEAFSYINLTTSVDAQYFEGNINKNAEFVSLKLNGVSSSLDNIQDVAVVYSDKTPFDVTSVIAYTEVSLAMLRSGNAGVNITSIPTDAKSFRLYSRARILPIMDEDGVTETGKYYLLASGSPEGITVGSPITIGYTNNFQTRLAYVSTTIQYDDDKTSIEDVIENVNKVVVSKSFYDLSGRQISAESAAKGVLIQKTVYEDGSSSFDKVHIK